MDRMEGADSKAGTVQQKKAEVFFVKKGGKLQMIVVE